MKKKNSRKRECGILQEIIQIATLQAMAQRQSPNNSIKNSCELANNNKPQHIQQDPLKNFLKFIRVLIHHNALASQRKMKISKDWRGIRMMDAAMNLKGEIAWKTYQNPK